MNTLLRALAKLVFAASLPAADNPPSNIASMIKQCEAKGRKDLGEKILTQWAKVLDKYPQTRINWATACALGGNSVKKNVFGGEEFIDWLAKELKTKPEGKNIPAVVIPEGTPAIAIPKKDETPEDWKTAAEETSHMLKEAEKAFASVGEFTDYLEKEIKELQRKLEEYGPGGDKHLLKSGKPHSFVSRLPKWKAQLDEYEKKLASVRESIAKSEEKFKTAAVDYDSAKVTTVAFESKVQDSLVDVLAFILDVKDLKKQKELLDKFQANLKNIDKQSAASVTADAGEFLISLWEKVLGYWNDVFSWAKGLISSVNDFSSIVHIMDGKEGVEAAWAPKEDGIRIDHNMVEVKGPKGQRSVMRHKDQYGSRGKYYSAEDAAKKLANETGFDIKEIKKALKKAHASTNFEDADVFELAEALDYWLQHNWEGQGDELYKAHCELTKPGMYKPSPMSKFENMEEGAKAIYDELTRQNYKEALDKVLNFDPEKEANAASKTVHFEVPEGHRKGYQACYTSTNNPELTQDPAKVTCSQCKYQMTLNAKEWKTGKHGKVIDFSGNKYHKAKSAIEMTCEDFYDREPQEFDTYMDEMYWEDAFSAEKLFEKMKKEAKGEGIKLVDEADFDYEDFFWEMYKTIEKGLS